MADILLDRLFDIIIDNGDIALCESLEDSYTQGGRLAIMTRKGSNVFHEQLGNNLYNDRVKLSDTALVATYCEDAILSSSSDIRSVSDIKIIRTDVLDDNMDVAFTLKMNDIQQQQIIEEEQGTDIYNIDNDMYEFD